MKKEAQEVSLLLLVLAVLLATLAGCQPGGEIARTQCMSYQKKINSGLAIYAMEHESAPSSLRELASNILVFVPVCPSGGTYEIVAGPDAPRVKGTVHGQLQETYQP